MISRRIIGNIFSIINMKYLISLKSLTLLWRVLKVLRIDNGGYFWRNECEEFYNKCGIERNKTNPYTPQYNGVAERMNMTLMEKTRCMPSGARLGK